jgi:rhodanese-related sulfurtransferase
MRIFYKIISFYFVINLFYSDFSLANESQSLVTSKVTPKVTQTALLSLQSSKSAFLLLDVRTVEEFNAGHIENAKNIPHLDIINNPNSLLPYKNKKIIIYCRSGRRAGLVEKELIDRGFINVLHLHGDMNSWQENKLPIATDKK